MGFTLDIPAPQPAKPETAAEASASVEASKLGFGSVTSPAMVASHGAATALSDAFAFVVSKN